MTNTSLLPLGLMARRVRVTAAWLREEALAGRIPHLDAGGRLLFNPEIVEAWLAARASAGDPAPNKLREIISDWRRKGWRPEEGGRDGQ